MLDPNDELLDSLLPPRTVDLRQVALILQPLYPDFTPQELERRVAEMAFRDGYRCRSEATPGGEPG